MVVGLCLAAGAVPAATAAGTTPTAASQADDLEAGTYIVALKGRPLATNPATAGSATQKVDTTSATARSYTDRLIAQQDAVLAQVQAEPTYRYTVALNGFAVKLTADEAAALSQRGDVLSVTRSTMRHLTSDSGSVAAPPAGMEQPDTDLSPDVLGLRGAGGVWEQLGGPMEAGKGQVVGVIDTGIAYDNPSFAADGMPAAPADWAGTCDSGEDGSFPADACTDKLVGARYFTAGAQAAGAQIDTSVDLLSPVDTDGHGSHVAGTASGREVSVQGYDMAGMAPGSHVAAYKVCWTFTEGAGCYPDDSIAAIDAAMADGVDVLNFSISGDPETYNDPVDLAFKNAAAAGIFVAASAGNSNEEGVPVAHLGPWQTTVGAAVHREEDGPVPSIASFSGRGPVAVAPEQQTILKPDIGAPGVNVLAAVASDEGPTWNWLTGTSMASPHIAGLGALLKGAHPQWSPMAVKSALLTSARDYADAESNSAFVGGTGFVEPRNFLQPGLVFDSGVADWDAFLANPAAGTQLNAAYVQIPQLGAEPTVVTRTVTNTGAEAATFTASYEGPDTLSVTVEPAQLTVPAGGTAEVTITVANTGAPATEWQQGEVTWTNGSTVVEIPVLARGEASDGPVDPEPKVERVFGADRYGTARAVSGLYPEDVDTVYIASGTGFADALAGSPAASRGLPQTMATPDGKAAPVLLVRNGSIPGATRAALDEIDPANVIVLGGTGAVSQAVEDELAGWGEVTRVQGRDRYETAANLALMFDGADKVYLASGEDRAFADALTGAARAGMEGAPVLLTRPGSVPAATANALASLGADDVVVLGGTGAVSQAVYTEVGADERLAGKDRYATAVAVSKVHGPDVPVVYLASGVNFPDALAGSALAGSEAVPVLLTKPGALPASTLAELNRLDPDRVVILGGTGAVSQAVEDELNEYYPGWAD